MEERGDTSKPTPTPTPTPTRTPTRTRSHRLDLLDLYLPIMDLTMSR